MRGRSVLHSRASDEWATPRPFFDLLNRTFEFELDAAATAENALCPRFLTRDDDALALPWAAASVWVNPPYSRCREFIAKAAMESATHGSVVVCLVPSRTDTRWFHDYIWDTERGAPKQGVAVSFIKGRLRFGDAPSSAPFPSMLVTFRL